MVKIVAMCGSGIGSSLLVIMGIQRVLKKNGYNEQDFQFEQADTQTGKGLAATADIIVTTPAFENTLDKDGPAAVIIKNLFSEPEIEEKLIPVLKQVLVRKKNKSYTRGAPSAPSFIRYNRIHRGVAQSG